jgi:hypothetical protein
MKEKTSVRALVYKIRASEISEHIPPGQNFRMSTNILDANLTLQVDINKEFEIAIIKTVFAKANAHSHARSRRKNVRAVPLYCGIQRSI